MNDKRTLPHSPESEAAFLGSILLNPVYGIPKASELRATPEAFYDRRNQFLFEFMQGLDGNRIDAILIAQILKDRGLLDKCGGYDRLVELQDSAVVEAHMESYWRNIDEKYRSRLLIDAATEALDAAYKGAQDSSQTAYSLAQKLEAIEPPNRQQMPDIIDEAAGELEAIARGEIVTLPFPWNRFQCDTFGIPMGAVTPLLGRDKTGKSRLAMLLVAHWIKLKDKQFPTLVFAFEDGRRRYLQALAATLGGYDSFAIRRNPSPQYIKKCKETIEQIKGLPIHVIDEAMTAEQVASTIGAYKRRHGIKAVVIDGFKDIMASKGENRTGEENHIFETIKRSAMKNDVGVLQIEHTHDIEDGRWISRRNIRGSKQRSQSARMFLVYQDQGIPGEILKRYGIEAGDGSIALDCQAASYGDRSYVILKPELERGTFNEIMPNEM